MRRRQVAIGDILRKALPDAARQRLYSVELIHSRWGEIVGEELAKRSEPEALRDGVLTVRVTDPAWGKMIYKLQREIVSALNRTLGSRLVKRLNFTKRSRLEGPTPEVRSVRGPRETLEPPEAVVDAAHGIEDPELKALVLASAAHYLKACEGRKRS